MNGTNTLTKLVVLYKYQSAYLLWKSSNGHYFYYDPETAIVFTAVFVQHLTTEQILQILWGSKPKYYTVVENESAT